jgi:NADPH:quinone reductase-like Zn-dependent oxidoreductase
MMGFAAVQMALRRGARVIATAGETFAPQLRSFGSLVTPYGEGLVERVRSLVEGPVDLALDTSPTGGVLPDLVEIVGGDPRQVMTIADFAAAQKLGVRDTFHEDLSQRVDALPEFAQLTAEGRFTVPVARTFPLDDWRSALAISQSHRARGKLVLVPSA